MEHLKDTAQSHAFSDRVLIRSIVGRPDGGAGLEGQQVRVGGWVKTGRVLAKGSFAFLELNDGSCPANLQVIVDAGGFAALWKLVATGTCMLVDGMLQLLPAGEKPRIDSIELQVEKVVHVGEVDVAKYPIQKTKLGLSLDHLHLRSRTNTIAAIARIRSELAFATHSFFYEHRFLYVPSPIITTGVHREGAGEMFQVTTLISEAEKLEKELIADIEVARQLVREKVKAVGEKLEAEASEEEISAPVAELDKAEERLSELEMRFNLRTLTPQKDCGIDYTQDFFARQAFLNGSGQLQVETYACGLSNVYTFGPTFRAEHSHHTSGHLEEFWMVEPEIAFADLEDDMNCAEAYVRYMCKWLLEKCLDDMEFMAEKYDKGCVERLKMVASTPFVRISYTEAVEILEEFDNKVEWGIDLAADHQRFLTEVKFLKPVIVYNYPKGIKPCPFHMRLNDDLMTVAAMDVLVPKVGELIGGSQREERYEVIRERMLEMGLPLEPYEWHLHLRRYGTVKHSGFGLDFERMILFATGMDNIREVIPFPRYPGRAETDL